MLRADGKCPYCKVVLADVVRDEEKYDWMIRSCGRCGKKYADDRYFEPALFHYTPQKMREAKVSTGWAAIVFGLVFLAGTIFAGWGFLGDPFCLDKLLLISVGLCLVGVYFLVRTILPKEREKYEILYGESLLRLQNAEYVQDLLDAGYEVPQDVLDDLRFVK